jgi:hypothetical protein
MIPLPMHETSGMHPKSLHAVIIIHQEDESKLLSWSQHTDSEKGN